MVMVRRFIILAFIAVSVLHDVFAAETESDISDVLNEFRQRIESLEARDAAKDVRIAELESEISELKSKMVEMETMHAKREENLQDQNDMLEKTMEHSQDVKEQASVNNDPIRQPDMPNRIKRRAINVHKRAVPETGVAFYATHTDHDIHHLGQDQVLKFQQVFTNVGNAYSSSSGTFVVPVAGTYVFHATLRGIDGNHVLAHFDVDGTDYANMYVTNNVQASQMLVINLTPGQSVSVRNNYLDTGFVGMHYSTFSGFLLYENDNPAGVIVG